MEAHTIQGQKYIYLTWDAMGSICFSLAKKILASDSSSRALNEVNSSALRTRAQKTPYNRLVALAKGGWTWARTMADYLAINKVASIQYEFYTNVAKTKPFPTLKQSLPISVEDEKLLVFDDIVDSGETLRASTDYLKKCGATSIATASLFFKPHSKFKPDFYAETTDAWVIFPHEIRESIEQLSEKWRKTVTSEKEIKNCFIKLGLPKEQMRHFIRGGEKSDDSS